jgi:hypothetical protein
MKAASNGWFSFMLSKSVGGAHGMEIHPRLGPSRFGVLAVFTLLNFASCSPARRTPEPVSAASEWHEFEGTWTAVGSRRTMPFGSNRRVRIANFSGSLLLAGAARPAVGFRAETLAFDDSATGMIGRAVWTDENGDQVYSELRGEGTEVNNKIVGTFLGGTGRYSGAIGGYEFSWRYVLEAEDGSVQGQSVGLKGRFRVGSPSGGAPDREGPQK